MDQNGRGRRGGKGRDRGRSPRNHGPRKRSNEYNKGKDKGKGKNRGPPRHLRNESAENGGEKAKGEKGKGKGRNITLTKMEWNSFVIADLADFKKYRKSSFVYECHRHSTRMCQTMDTKPGSKCPWPGQTNQGTHGFGIESYSASEIQSRSGF